MTAKVHAMERWSLPDWTVQADYPDAETAPRTWRWEFLRRRPDYRAEWEKGPTAVNSIGPEEAYMRFGVRTFHDPRTRFSEAELDELSFLGAFVVLHAGDVESDAFVTYSFDLSKPIDQQIAAARESLLAIQIEEYGRKKNSPRPRIFNWPLFLRALDARECGATYATMAEVFWPQEWQYGEKTEQSVRDVLKEARRVRDNFPG